MPKPPSVRKMTQQQTIANRQAAQDTLRANAIDRYGPYGSTTFDRDAQGNPVAQRVSLSPQMQGIFDTQADVQGGIAGASHNALGFLPGTAFDPSTLPGTDQIAQTFYDSKVARMTPQFNDTWRNLEVTLSDRGIPIGSEVWNTEQDRFERAKNEALGQAAMQAELAAGNEYQRLFGNALATRNQGYNELGRLVGMQSGVPVPDYVKLPGVSVAAPDVTSAAWSNYAARQQNYALPQLLGAGFKVASNPANLFGFRLW